MSNNTRSHIRFSKCIPDGDDHERSVCDQCGFIDYENPKVVVGSVVTAPRGLLLCKRAIEPRRGFWTIPAGYLELNEAPDAGAMREAEEEAMAAIRIDRLLAIYSIPRISQVQLIYRASLKSPAIAPGPESEAVAIVPYAEIPWADLAFPSVKWALEAWHASRDRDDFAPFANPVGEAGEMGEAGGRDG